MTPDMCNPRSLNGSLFLNSQIARAVQKDVQISAFIFPPYGARRPVTVRYRGVPEPFHISLRFWIDSFCNLFILLVSEILEGCGKSIANLFKRTSRHSCSCLWPPWAGGPLVDHPFFCISQFRHLTTDKTGVLCIGSFGWATRHGLNRIYRCVYR